MLSLYRQTRYHDQKGFTLIELMLVVLIMGILLAVAVPTFLGSAGGAEDRAAQSNLMSALTTVKSAYEQNGQSYSIAGGGQSITAAVLLTDEPNLLFTPGAIPVPRPYSISTTMSQDGSGMILAAYSKTGKCYYLVDNEKTISAINWANEFPPYGTWVATHAATPDGTPGSSGQSVYMPTTVGLYYGETSGDSSVNDCNAVNPVNPVGATWWISTSGFSH